MQVKLLRVIQEKTVRPVGEQRESSRPTCGILSATHKNLAELVAQGRFREDLYYRINVIELRVPRCASAPRTSRNSPRSSCAGWRAARTWRRSRSPPRRCSCCATTPFPATCANWKTSWNARAVEQAAPAAPLSAGTATTQPLPVALGPALQGVEREAIVRALEQHRYNKTATARALGMSFRALRYRIKKLGIE
jgi:two-component system response regulator PilR (NtrC family)